MPVTVYVDTREPKKTSEYFRNKGFAVIEQCLETGDIVSGNTENGVCIERKQIGDLWGSIQGHLWEQAANMQPYKHKYLMISGSVKELKACNRTPTLEAIASLSTRYGLNVLMLPDDESLYYTAVAIIKKHCDGREMQTVFVKKVGKSNPGLAIVMSLPGISEKKAKVLLEKFKTPHGVMNSFVDFPEEVELIDGFGAKSIDKVREALTGEDKCQI